jgi:hypothetical protein
MGPSKLFPRHYWIIMKVRRQRKRRMTWTITQWTIIGEFLSASLCTVCSTMFDNILLISYHLSHKCSLQFPENKWVQNLKHKCLKWRLKVRFTLHSCLGNWVYFNKNYLKRREWSMLEVDCLFMNIGYFVRRILLWCSINNSTSISLSSQ